MKKFFSPVNLLLYLLTTLAAFIGGMMYANFTGAADGQGLAGGAIVLGYGVMFALIALILSLFVASYLSTKIKWGINIFLLLFIGITIFVLRQKYKQRQKERASSVQPASLSPKKAVSLPAEQYPVDGDQVPMGMGFFKPDFFEQSTLYFYGNLNFDKTVQDHTPIDSMTFAPAETGGYEIKYAPPWLDPDHLKMDYDLLYFRVQSVTRDFLKVTANLKVNKTVFVDRYAGKILYWPEFLLQVNDIEIKNPADYLIRIKPMSHVAPVNTSYVFLVPQIVEGDWIKVRLFNNDYEQVDEGWLQWRKDGRLLIDYSLLS